MKATILPYARFCCSVLSLLIAGEAVAATRYAIATGNWSAASTWTNNAGGCAAAAAGGIPASGDSAIICANRTVTFDTAGGVTTGIKDITVRTGATLQGLNSTAVLQVGAGGGEDVSVLGTLDFSSAHPAKIQLSANSVWGCTDSATATTSCGTW